MLIGIPKWAKLLKIESDGTVWAHAYNPDVTKDEMGGQPIGRNQREVYLVGVMDPPELLQEQVDLPDMLNEEQRFIRNDRIITDRVGRPYKELVLEAFLDKYHRDKEEDI